MNYRRRFVPSHSLISLRRTPLKFPKFWDGLEKKREKNKKKKTPPKYRNFLFFYSRFILNFYVPFFFLSRSIHPLLFNILPIQLHSLSYLAIYLAVASSNHMASSFIIIILDYYLLLAPYYGFPRDFDYSFTYT